MVALFLKNTEKLVLQYLFMIVKSLKSFKNILFLAIMVWFFLIYLYQILLIIKRGSFLW